MAPRRPLAKLLAATLAAAVAVAGCLGDAPPSVAPTPTREPEPTPTTTTYDLATSVWYEGILISVNRAVATLDQRGGPVTVELELANSSVDEMELKATIYLVVGDSRIAPTRESKIPPLPAEAEVAAAMTYELQGISSADAATIEIGDPPDHVGIVPLTPSAGTAVTLQPRVLTLAGEGAAGDLEITLTGGVQRWDLPDWSQELAADRQAITVTYDATFTGGFPGGFPFTGENVALRLPDGTDVAPREDGHSQAIELIGAGRTKRDLFSRFEIPASVRGFISFVVTDGDEEQLIPLAIPG
jgi:hypothetical protein